MKKFTIVFVLFLYAIVFAQAQSSKIIAVAAVDRTGNSQISQAAGHAPYYLIFDKNGKLLEVVSNPFRDAASGAGPKVAGLLAEKNVTVVVAGDFGYKMKIALDEKVISHLTATGVVQKTVQGLLNKSN
jgi:predicted Fe-Mo cluster-binding NifX family protein